MTGIAISNKTRTAEIIAVVTTAVGKFLFMDYLNWRFIYIITAIAFWVGYIIYRSRTKPGILRHWGFRTDNFWLVTKKVLPFGLLAVITFAAVGFYQGTINLTWHIIPILILYPLWGTIQQFLLIALTAGNMHDMQGQRLNKWMIIFIAAVLFAIVHYPFVWLMIATFVLAVFYGWIYLRQRNVYVLGLFHGWLGGIFYYTVLGRDPYTETFGRLV
jgi:uncharacterized protein